MEPPLMLKNYACLVKKIFKYCKMLKFAQSKSCQLVMNIYRPSISVMPISFDEDAVLSLPLPGSASLRAKYIGCVGIGSCVVLFSSMDTTADMSGLQSGLS